MEYRKTDCKSYNIYTIKTDNFKTIKMEIIFSREVKKDEMQAFTFLCDFMTNCSKKYSRKRDVSIRLEELYNAVFYGSSQKIGNLFTTIFTVEFIEPSYINDKNYLEDVLSFVFGTIKNPNVNNNEFDLTNFNIVKKSLMEDIQSIEENSDKLAIRNALNTMDSSSPSSFEVLGTIEELERLTPEALYNTYLDLINHSNCDIFVVGNTNMDEIIKLIKNNFNNHVIKNNKPKLYVDNKKRKKPCVKEEKSVFLQSNLVMIYNITDEDEKLKNIFHVFNYLLGAGGITSKLYKNLRTDNSLCYAVRSMYFKYDRLLTITVSLDKSNVSTARKLIEKSIKELINGDFTDETLEDAKNNLIFSLKTILDSNGSILNNYVFHIYDELPLIDERIKMISQITKEDIIECGKSLTLNTVYIQSAGDENERN